MSGVTGMASFSASFLDDLQKEREDGNEIMVASKTATWSLTTITALRDALKRLRFEDLPLDKSGKSHIRKWKEKRGLK